MPTLTTSIIEAAIAGFEQKRATIDTQIAELRAMLQGVPAKTNAEPTSQPEAPKKRTMSAAGRKAIAEAQKKRWANSREETTPTVPLVKKAAKKGKRRLSPEGRAAIVAAAKKRWAARKAA